MKIKDIKIGKRFRKDFGDLESLKNSIQKLGLIHSVVVDENKNLIAGERRVEACKQLYGDNFDISHREITSENKEQKETDENVVREDFLPSEAVDIWDSLESFQFERSGRSDSDQPEQRRKQATKRTGYSHDTLSKAKKVIESKNKELIKEMDKRIRGSNVNSAYRKWKMKKDEKELMDTKDVKGKFRTIVIDPPWEYKVNIFGRTTPTYKLMSDEELVQFKEKIDEWVAEDTCHLYMWTTNAFIWKSIDLGKQWGFEYKTCITWCKDKIGMGSYFRNSTEHLLFFIKKGSKSTRDKSIGTWFEAKRGEHSEKPDKAYEIVEKMSYSPYLDIFGRKKRKGWTVYGNIRKLTSKVSK